MSDLHLNFTTALETLFLNLTSHTLRKTPLGAGRRLVIWRVLCTTYNQEENFVEEVRWLPL